MAGVRKYQVDVIHDREVTRTVYTKEPIPGDEKKRTRLVQEEKTEVVEESYMVYFPGGHSIWYETKEAMNAAGIYLGSDVVIDPETGEPVVEMDLKKRSEALSTYGARRRATA